ncbi:hypothetical protein H4R19_004514 [Coemansia spiralis]|nr:hypothetical protein H4R19_004514 [Coemansia spiralis]
MRADGPSPLGPSLETQAMPERHKVHTGLVHESVAGCLLDEVLTNFVAMAQAPGFDAKAPLDDGDFVLRVNEYPCYIGDGVEHWVLRCPKPLPPGLAALAAAARVVTHWLGSGAEWG